MIGYNKHFECGNNTMFFKVIDDKLLKNSSKIWEKVSSFTGIKFDSEPVYGDNDKYITTKIKLYGGKINTNFQGKKKTKKIHHISVCH